VTRKTTSPAYLLPERGGGDLLQGGPEQVPFAQLTAFVPESRGQGGTKSDEWVLYRSRFRPGGPGDFQRMKKGKKEERLEKKSSSRQRAQVTVPSGQQYPSMHSGRVSCWKEGVGKVNHCAVKQKSRKVVGVSERPEGGWKVVGQYGLRMKLSGRKRVGRGRKKEYR